MYFKSLKVQINLFKNLVIIIFTQHFLENITNMFIKILFNFIQISLKFNYLSFFKNSTTLYLINYLIFLSLIFM